MTYHRKHTIYFRRGNGRRGSVIVLVVAVLALLAVIGTVYIVSARTERSGAVADSAGQNLDLAQQALNEYIRRIIGDPIYDGTGTVGGLAVAGSFGGRTSRRHDMPELNALLSGAAGYDPTSRDQSWLCSNLYRGVGGSGYFNDLTMPQSTTFTTDAGNGSTRLVPSVFNPIDGAHDIPVISLTNGVANFNNLVFVDGPSSNGFFHVVADLLPAGARNDAIIQLLPFSEANGTRYRFGLRILDTSAMANLNAGLPFGVSGLNAGVYGDSSKLYGTYSSMYSLTSPAIFNNGDNATATAISLAVQGGWSPSNTTPIGYLWNQLGFRMESPSLLPGITPYDLGDELELRSYGDLGTLAMARPAMTGIWPNTLANRAVGASAAVGNAARGNFTTYSYSRDLRPYSDPVDPSTGVRTDYQLLPSAGTWQLVLNQTVPPVAVPPGNTNAFVWPPFPAKVNALPDISAYTNNTSPPAATEYQYMADRLAIAATNIATAIRESFHDGSESAFAANYLTSRWNGWQTPAESGKQGYYLKNGPSYIDNTGVHLRTVADAPSLAAIGVDYQSTMTPSPATKVFVGYAAQPFLNEVAIESYKDLPMPPGDGTVKEYDAAIELYNPYNVPLSLDDFEIDVNGVKIDFTGKNLWIPARGYFVLTNFPNKLDTLPTPVPATAQKADATTLGSPFALKGAAAVVLKRKYFDNGGGVHWATVDQFNVAAIADPQPPDQTHVIDFEARPNDDADVTKDNLLRWNATMDVAASYAKHTSPADTLTLGTVNSSTGELTTCVPLYDRTLELFAASAYPTDNALVKNYRRLIPQNVADFNRIMRMCNETDASTGDSAGNGSVSVQVGAAVSAGPYGATNSDYPADARVHFDFRSDPNARHLLDYLTFSDRVSDYSIDLGDNQQSTPSTMGPLYSQGISKLRVPGKINVNTAPPNVLLTIPVLYGNQDLLNAILCYRWRTANTVGDPRVPAASPHAYDFSDPAKFPGYGISSLSELQIPILAWQSALAADASMTYINMYPTINTRDQVWGALYNALTVRSDTFVVYAYLEAVRQNPRYTGTFDNATIWYTTDTNTGISDDPNDSHHALTRIARRRWVEIVDRSQSDFSRFVPGTAVLDPRFSQPPIVAQKEMPR